MFRMALRILRPKVKIPKTDISAMQMTAKTNIFMSIHLKVSLITVLYGKRKTDIQARYSA